MNLITLNRRSSEMPLVSVAHRVDADGFGEISLNYRSKADTCCVNMCEFEARMLIGELVKTLEDINRMRPMGAEGWAYRSLEEE